LSRHRTPIIVPVVPDELLSRRWRARVERDAEGAPTVSPLFVVQQGAGVQIVDLRAAEEATGILGHVAGSAFLGPEEIPSDMLVVLVDADGRKAAQVALDLERAGMTHVAALAGGLAAWRRLGLGISREPARPLEPRRARDREGPLSIEEVREHVGDPRAVRWMKLSLLVTLGHFSCIDGRDGRGVIGTPGGDAGEFILAMAAHEQVTGLTLDEEAVMSALLAHLDAFGDFYMHTDAQAVQQLLDDMRADERLRPSLAGIDDPEELVAFLRRPPESAREALLEHLVLPDHIGCGHIRSMLQHGDEYEVRSELVEAFLRAFHRLRWLGAPELILTMLPGEHEEAAVVNVRVDGEIWSLAPVPLVSPACGGTQMFVNHPDVSSHLRRLIVKLHARGDGPLAIDPARESELQAAVQWLAAKQLTATVRRFAARLPIYDVAFRGQGAFEVRTP